MDGMSQGVRDGDVAIPDRNLFRDFFMRNNNAGKIMCIIGANLDQLVVKRLPSIF
jgi:hypothetical protein